MSGSDFDKYLMKQIMNRGFGKFAQYKTEQEIFLDKVENTNERLAEGCEIIGGVGNQWRFRKDKPGSVKRYHCPIIPCLITGYSRVIMFNYLKKLSRSCLLYTDTDSIYVNNKDVLNLFNVSNNLGDFKLEHENEDITIYGRKTYMVGKLMKISGTEVTNVSPDDFRKGIVSSKRMLTLKTTNDTQLLGSFNEFVRDLNEELGKHQEFDKKMENQKLYIDERLRNVQYEVDFIKEYLSCQQSKTSS